MQDDPIISEMAILADAEAFKYCSYRLRTSPDFIVRAANANGDSMKYLDVEIRRNRNLVK